MQGASYLIYGSGRAPCLSAGVTDPRVPTTKFKARERETRRYRAALPRAPMGKPQAARAGGRACDRVTVESDEAKEASRKSKLANEIKRFPSLLLHRT